MRYQATGKDGRPLDALYEVEQGTIVLHSRGGSSGAGTVRNGEYSPALRVLLERLRQSGRWVSDAAVHSALALRLDPESRRIVDLAHIPQDADELIAEMSSRMILVARRPGAKGGTRSKRIQLTVAPPTTDEVLGELLRGVPVPGDRRSEERLPVEQLEKVQPEFIRRAVRKLRNGFNAHGFGESTDYDLLDDDGSRLAPKAAFGVAASEALGFEVQPKHFVGGEESPCFRLLRAAGYQIVPKSNESPSPSEDPKLEEPTDWADDEITAAIDGYFEMYRRQSSGVPFVKAEILREVAKQTRSRTIKSVKRKFENISAVLVEMDLDPLEGYVPSGNYQGRLAELVDEYLTARPELRLALEADLDRVPPTVLAPGSRSEIEEPPPPPRVPASSARSRPGKTTGKVDRAKHDAANRELGRLGEQFVVDLERRELRRLGRRDLADRVRWVAEEDGDGAGYDILSFDVDGNEVWIEVKTTNGPKRTAFFISSNEVLIWAANPDRFRLYRLFSFAKDPRFYSLAGNVAELLELDATAYRARPK